MKKDKLILVLGTSSGSGKSTFVTALCRILSNKGLRVAPFKAANMSRNSVSLDDGSEISRAQWLQAIASRSPPEMRMNPILLKPEGERQSQVILTGRSIGVKSVQEYQGVMRGNGKAEVKGALDNLLERFDVVVAEGAGSPAEINLREWDLSNSFILDNYDPQAILVADIERGGIFASILGTIELMSKPEKLKGIVINKMRGDEAILKQGKDKIEEMTGKKFLGVIPFLDSIHLPGEDSLDYDREEIFNPRVCVIKYPFIENYSDLDPLIAYGIGFSYVTDKNKSIIDRSDVIILPGSKNVFQDIEFLKSTGLWKSLLDARNNGKKILGICGGFQILSNNIKDPEKVQSDIQDYQGLGLLNSTFIYRKEKVTARIQYYIENEHLNCKKINKGYEIHYGDILESDEATMSVIGRRKEGAISADGRVMGTNIHGILENSCFLNYLTGVKLDEDYGGLLEKNIDILAKRVEGHLDISRILDFIN